MYSFRLVIALFHEDWIEPKLLTFIGFVVPLTASKAQYSLVAYANQVRPYQTLHNLQWISHLLPYLNELIKIRILVPSRRYKLENVIPRWYAILGKQYLHLLSASKSFTPHVVSHCFFFLPENIGTQNSLTGNHFIGAAICKYVYIHHEGYCPFR